MKNAAFGGVLLMLIGVPILVGVAFAVKERFRLKRVCTEQTGGTLTEIEVDKTPDSELADKYHYEFHNGNEFATYTSTSTWGSKEKMTVGATVTFMYNPLNSKDCYIKEETPRWIVFHTIWFIFSIACVVSGVFFLNLEL